MGATAMAAYTVYRTAKKRALTLPQVRSKLRQVYVAAGVTGACLAAPMVITHLTSAATMTAIYGTIFSSRYSFAAFGSAVASATLGAFFLPTYEVGHASADGPSGEPAPHEPESAYGRGQNKQAVIERPIKVFSKIKLASWLLASIGGGLLLAPLGGLSTSLLATSAGYSVGLSIAAHTTAYMAASTTGFIVTAPLAMTATALGMHAFLEALRYPFVTVLLPTVASCGVLIGLDALALLNTVAEDPDEADPVHLGMRTAGVATFAFLRILYKLYKMYRTTARLTNKAIGVARRR